MSTRPDRPDAALLRDLLCASARGDASAFERFFHATQARARVLCARYANGPAAADELCADVYVAAWRRAPGYDPARGSAWTWLAILVRSLGIDALRRASTLPQAQSIDEHVPESIDRHDCLARVELIRAALDELRAEDREVVEHALYGGLSHSAIAAKLDLPLGTVKTRARLARAQMHEFIARRAG